MPLSHGKSKKAFSENVRTEMHHGHPLKQSLAIAYSVMRKSGHKMAKGGVCEACGGECKYSEGGKAEGISEAGKSVRNIKAAKEGRDFLTEDLAQENAYRGHEKQLEKIEKTHPKLKGLAKGGEVKGVHKSFVEDSDLIEDKHWAGKSKAGNLNDMNDLKGYNKQKTLDEHHRVLGEMHAMKKPNLKGLAKGGEVKGTLHNSAIRSFMAKGEFDVGSSDKVSPKLLGKMKMKYDEGDPVLPGADTAQDSMRKAFKFDEGGEAGEHEDHELHESVMHELMEAIKSGNKKEALSALKALMMSLKE